MIITKFYRIRSDGIRLVKTYSDLGMMIERDGVLYLDAVDPENTKRTYNETDIPAVKDKEYIDDKILDNKK